MENANEAILVAQDGMLKFANPKAAEITGYSEDELVSIPFAELIHPDDREMVLERHLKRLMGKNFCISILSGLLQRGECQVGGDQCSFDRMGGKARYSEFPHRHH